MAKVHLLNNHTDPVNDGEVRALKFLADRLPDSVTLIPNLTIPFAFPETPEEYDIIAVAPDAVFVIEVKDLAPSLEFTEQDMIIGGSVRRNPYLTSRIKAQKLRSRLNNSLPWFKTGGWVEHIVVLARKPAGLVICNSMKNRIVELPVSAPLVGPGTPLLNPKHHGQLDGKVDTVVAAVVGDAVPRTRPTIFGQFEGTSEIFSHETLSAWKASNRVSGLDVILEMHRRPHGLAPAQVESWKSGVLRMLELSRDIGPSSDFDAPRDAFDLDDGTIVVVWPDRDQNTLRHFLTQMGDVGSGFDAVRARRAAAGFAGAVHHLHSNGWLMGGPPAPHDMVIRPSGRGGVILGSPSPVKGADTMSDLKWLGGVLAELNAKVSDDLLAELVNALTADKNSERPSAGLVQARLEGAVLPRTQEQPPAASVATDPFGRFTDSEVLVHHKFGTTLKAHDVDLKRTVIVKRESGRPEASWALREYRALSVPSVANNPHTVSVLGGGVEGDESYVVTEFVDGPSLATLIDGGNLREPERAAAVTAQLLSVLDAIHPDINRISELVDNVDGVISGEVQDEIGRLRDEGLAHNHLDPTNIFVVEDRGVVVTDFVRAARFGDVIPHRSSRFWPPGQSTEVSDPSADLFAVGVLLLRMLTTSEDGVDASGNGQSPQVQKLVDVALKAVSDDPSQRFRTAIEFLDELTSIVAVARMPEIRRDLFVLQQEIESLISGGKFDEALKKCPTTWRQTIARIVEKRELANRAGAVLLEIQGLTLQYDGKVEIGPGTTSANNIHDGGTADSYIVTVPDGGVLEIRVCAAEVDGSVERWVGVEQGFGYPDRMDHAVRSHRMSISVAGDNEWMEITQSQLKRSAIHANQATKKQVTEAGLSAPLGSEAREILERFGVTEFGTREKVLGETNKRRFYLAAVFGPDAQHAPAVVHFVSRLVPLYMGVEEQ